MTLLLLVVAVALAFDYLNGSNDTGNAIATVVSTKVLTPRQAVVLAACTNLLGALCGTAVAKTISSGLVDAKQVVLGPDIITCALRHHGCRRRPASQCHQVDGCRAHGL